MRFLSRLFAGALALTLALSLWASPAQAASKKKKSYSSEESSSSTKHVVSGMNQQGRSGYFFGDTSSVAGVGKLEGEINLTYQSIGSGFPASGGGVTYSGGGANIIGFPAGIHFGIDENMEISVAELGQINIINSSTVSGFGVTVTSPGSSSTAFAGVVGFKYRIPPADKHTPEFSLGGNVMTNISPNFGNVFFITPEGTCTYVLPSNGMELNGDFGVAIATQGTSYVKLDLGAAYPFSNKFAGIAELGANQGGYTASMFAFGVRSLLGEGMKGQAYLGVPLNGGSVIIGIGLILGSI